MKIRKHRLSLAVGIIVMLLGLASGAASFIALRGMGGEKLPSLISSIGYYAGFPEGTASLVALSAFLFFGGLFILAFRKKKRVSMVFSILFHGVGLHLLLLAFSCSAHRRRTRQIRR